MIKEELEKEAIKYAVDYPTSYGKGYKHKDLRIAYLAGAEPREKQIAELEKENKTVSRKANEAIADKLLIIAKFNEVLNSLNQQNDTLQKENTKLKTDYEVLSCSVGDFDELQNKLEEEQRKNNGLSDNLTKAKEIIKELVRVEYADFTNGDYSNELSKVLEQAEQFLSEVEND